MTKNTGRSAKDLEELREVFVAEFGEHRAANSETGRLLGFDQPQRQAAAEAAEDED
jgi:hypothetical protein